MRIVLCYPVERHHLEAIRAAAPGCEVIDAGQEGIAEELLAADIYCGHAKTPVPWDEVVRRGRLKWIQSSAAGLDHCLPPAVVDSDIVVTSASGVLSDQVAEHGLALLLAVTRSLPVFFRAAQRREFIRRPTRDLHHRSVGIVGLGGVGRRFAEVIAPFRGAIRAVDTFPRDKPAHVAELWPAERLDDLLALSDVLFLSVPLTDITRGLIDRAALEKLPADAILANLARGPIVVEDDLVAALESGHLAGAVLDVTHEEPLPPTSRLWDLDNVIITPHVAGQSARRIDNMTRFFCGNL